jgi:addiction module HigA family antidote
MTITREELESGRVTFDKEEYGPLMDPIHPGEHLEEFMSELGLSARQLARRLGVPHTRILGILAGRRAISAETALRLARFFGTSAKLWMGLQAAYDREVAERAHGEAIRREVQPLDRAAA